MVMCQDKNFWNINKLYLHVLQETMELLLREF